LKRREILKSALLGIGVWKTGTAQIRVQKQLVPGPGPVSESQPLGWKPSLFDDHQAKTVEALAERIIPGAREAKVAEYIDLVLHDGPAEPRNAFLEGLGRLDGLAIRTYRKPFLRCGEDEQTALLRQIEDTSFFRQLKKLTVEGYYTSEAGIEELNRGGVPESYGCPHSAH